MSKHDDEIDETTYEIVRFYQRLDVPAEIVMTGLTLQEAKEHCNDPETSSRTCSTAEGDERTARFGPWFEGFRAE